MKRVNPVRYWGGGGGGGGGGIGPLTMKTVGDFHGQSQNIADNFPESLAVNPVYL